MPRLIATYRWELWLLVGIPAIAQTARIVMSILVVSAFPVSDSNAVFYIDDIGVAAVVILLLTLSYPRVRGLEREFLALLWGHRIASAVLAAIIQSAALLLEFASSGEESAVFLSVGRMFLLYLAATPVHIGILLWFARRASRISLPHAFFLVAFSAFAAPPASSRSSDAPLAFAFSMAVGSVIVLMIALAKAWLLGEFDRRGVAFRRKAVAALIAAALLSGWARSVIPLLLGGGRDAALQAYAPFAGLVTGSVAFASQTVASVALLFLYFALVYFVRERRAVEASRDVAAPGGV